MKKKVFSILFALVLVCSFSLVTAVPAGAADPTTIESSAMVFEGALANNGGGTYSGTIPLTAAFDVYARDGANAVFFTELPATRYDVTIANHDGWPAFDPDTPDVAYYALTLDGNTWKLVYNEANPRNWEDQGGVPMSGVMDWNTMYASETDMGFCLGELDGVGAPPGDANYGWAAENGGGAACWDMDWLLPWGSEVVPLAFPGFDVDIQDLGDGNYRVTMTPAAGDNPAGPVDNERTGESYGTIQDAIDAASSGDTIIVAAGTYEDTVDVGPVVNIMDKSLTLLGAQADVPIVEGYRAGDESILRGKGTGSTRPFSNSVVSITHSDVVVNGFTIENGQCGIFMAGGVEGISNILVSYNYIKDTGTSGFHAGVGRNSAVAYVTIDHNYIASNLGRGILTNGGGTTITNNTFYGNGIGIDFQGGDPYSLPFPDYADPNYPTLISGNSFTNDSTSIKLRLDECHQSITITGNDITEARNDAIRTWNTYDEDIANPAIHYNNIVGSTNFGINNEVTEITLDATSNWWGDPTGPGGEGLGTGDGVSTNVNYNPWYNTSELTTKTYYVGSGEDYTTIQSAINAANPAGGDTVIVAAGTYVEAVKIDRELILEGANVGIPGSGTRDPESIIKPDDTTPLYDGNNRRVAIKVETVDGVTIDGFEIDGTGEPVHQGILVATSDDCIIRNNVIHDITNDPALGDVGGVGINVFGWEQGISGTLIEGNTVYNTGRMGIIVSAWGPSAWLVCNDNIFRDNTVHDAWQGPTEDYGGAVQINVAKDSLIEGNTIYDTGLDQYGIYIPASVLSANRIVENDIYNNEIGIVIWSDDSVSNYGEGDPGPPEVHYNNIYNNTDRGLQVTDTDPVYEVDAEDNWWGTLIGSEIAEMVSGNVDYSPWRNAPYPGGQSTSLDVTTIDLAEGWNLISLPLIPKDSTILTVLDGVDVEKVAGYSPFQDWKFYTPPDVPSDLEQMNDGWGYWVDMGTTTARLTVSGYEFCKPAPAMPPDYDLVPGWNLIGFKSLSPIEAGTYLDELEPVMRAMYGYDTTSDVYTVILATTDLVPGKGYWLAVSAEGTIYP